MTRRLILTSWNAWQ